jgi:opacity protein-like surface antigen
MKRRAWVSVIAAAIILAVSAAPARAQFYIGARGGLSNQDVERTGDLGDIKFDKDSAFLYGGQVGFKFSALAVEGEFYRADHDLLSGDPSIPAAGVELDYYYLGVNGKLGILLVVVYPYITVGYGTYSADLAGFGKDSDTAFNVGAGAELLLGKLGIFGEVRYKDFSFELDNQKWDFGGVELHFGLNVHF